MGNKKITDAAESTVFDKIFVNDGGGLRQIQKNDLMKIISELLVDTTLTEIGKAAGAKETGDELTSINNSISNKYLEKVLIYYGYPMAINSAWSVDGACNIYNNYDVVVFGDKYEDPAHEAHADTVSIFNKIKESGKGTKIVGYVPIGALPDAADSNLPMETLKSRVDQWYDMGANGIFLDEFGFDYYVTRARQNEIITYVKSKGMFVFVNSWSIKYIFSSTPMTISWMPNFEPNPNGLPCLLDDNDYSLFENLFYTSETVTGTDGVKTINLKCASPWRIEDAYAYYNTTQEEYGTTYYDRFKTKIVSLDGIPSNLDIRHKNILQTISLFGAKIFNIPCLAFGDEKWGATGYYHDWGLADVNLTESTFHGVSKETKVGSDTKDFPYKWSANINGHTYSVTFDIPNASHTEWVDGMRYASVDGVAVENAWQTIYDFQTSVADAIEKADTAIATADNIKTEVDNVMPTLQNAEANIKAITAEAEAKINDATTKLEAGLADLEAVTAGFGFKEVQW